MKIQFTIHNSHLLDFDCQLVENQVSSRLFSVLSRPVLSEWIGSVDWVEADLWIWDEGISGFCEHPFVEFSREEEVFSWGTIHGRLSWSSIYLDQNHELLQVPSNRLYDHLLMALLYMLADLARQENESTIASWIEDNYIPDSSQTFIQELSQGQAYFESADDLILVLEFSIKSPYKPSGKDYELQETLVEKLDMFLNQNDVGYVDGSQIGGGSIEVFCVIKDHEKDTLKIKKFLAENELPTPIDCYLE